MIDSLPPPPDGGSWLLQLGVGGVLVIALLYIGRIFTRIYEDIRVAEGKRTEAVIAVLNNHLAQAAQITTSLSTVVSSLVAASHESRELLREIRDLRERERFHKEQDK